MGLKDLFKDVTDLAKESIDSIQADLALKKEEQDRLRAEMELRIKTYTDTLLEQLLNPADAPAQPLINATDEEVLEFTKEFNDCLLYTSDAADE